jgi:hypothetical protein
MMVALRRWIRDLKKLNSEVRVGQNDFPSKFGKLELDFFHKEAKFGKLELVFFSKQLSLES